MSLIAILTLIASIVMPFMTLMHVRRMIKEKSSLGQSVGYPIMLTAGSFLWLLYGIELVNFILILTNVLWIIMNGIYIACILKYK